jgi:hypothetical protein
MSDVSEDLLRAYVLLILEVWRLYLGQLLFQRHLERIRWENENMWPVCGRGKKIFGDMRRRSCESAGSFNF